MGNHEGDRKHGHHIAKFLADRIVNDGLDIVDLVGGSGDRDATEMHLLGDSFTHFGFLDAAKIAYDAERDAQG